MVKPRRLKKTKLMLEAEQRVGKPLEQALVELYEEGGLPLVCERLGVPKSTVWYWFLRCGINIERRAVKLW